MTAPTTTFQPSKPTTDLGGPMVRSVILHSAVILAMWAAFGVQERKIEQQETRVRETLERKVAEIAEEQEAIQQEVAQEAVRDDIRMMLTALVHDSVPEEDLDTLVNDFETSLDDLFAQDSSAWESLGDTEMDALRADALQNLRQRQEALLTKALTEQIRTYVREELVPNLQAEVENRLKSQAGKNIERQATKALSQAKRDRKLSDDDVRNAAEASTDAITAQVETALKESITNDLIPKASERVMNAFDKDIKKLPIDSEHLKALVEADIKTAMTEELAATNPSADAATYQLEQRHKLADAKALAAAQSKTSAAAAKMAQLADKQHEISIEPPEDAISKQPAQQALVSDMESAFSDARQAVDQANRAANDDKRLDEARTAAKEAKAVDSASEAEKQLRNGIIEDATASMTESEQSLREAAASLAKAAEALGEQAATAREQAPTPTTASAAVAATAEATAAATAETSASETTKAVESATKSVKIDNVLGDMDRLKKLADLGNKLDAAAKRMEEGRDVGAPSLLPSAGLLSVAGRAGTGSIRGRATLNRDAYEKFVKDLQNRMNPENAFADVAAVSGMATKAKNKTEDVAATALVTDAQRERMTELTTPKPDAPERKLADPDFATPAYGGAPMLDTALTIDGDLSDWGELTHGLRIRWNGADAVNPQDTGIDVHMRWSTKGIFFAYIVPKDDDISIPKADTPYHGDAIEVWLDLDNSRKNNAGKSDTAHQFMIPPFGVQGDPSRRFYEYLHGQRKLRPGLHDREGKGFSAAKKVGEGYSVEVFIDRSALAKPVLLPGQTLAMNLSINLGNQGNQHHIQHWQWSASKAISTYNKPDTWGDVVLLGADAKLRYFDLANPDTTIESILPGQALGLEIIDADMNLRDDVVDRVAATVSVDGRDDRLFVILDEIGKDTGTFRASVDVQAFIATADDHTLAARSGQIITLTYQDPRGAYGEQNREIKQWLPVAYGAQKLNSKTDITP